MRKETLAKRFYAHASCEAREGGWALLLDGKAANTPARKLLNVPQRAVADAMAAEWNAQGTHIDKATMPITSLACVVIDTLPAQRSAMLDELMAYAHTDQLCYREPMGTPWGDALRHKQDAHYAPISAWLQQQYGVALVTTDGMMPIPQPQATLDALRLSADALNDWQLVALHFVASVTKSLSVALAFMHGILSTPQTVAIATLEETTQADQWGMDDEQAARIARWQADIEAVGAVRDALAA